MSTWHPAAHRVEEGAERKGGASVVRGGYVTPPSESRVPRYPQLPAIRIVRERELRGVRSRNGTQGTRCPGDADTWGEGWTLAEAGGGVGRSLSRQEQGRGVCDMGEGGAGQGLDLG